ncbi:MAG TPA: hypothetical protein VNE39_01080 [Planctomycetota bacterium]|nr:hypothetical protein [Planctomycetota bacterium]
MLNMKPFFVACWAYLVAYAACAIVRVVRRTRRGDPCLPANAVSAERAALNQAVTGTFGSVIVYCFYLAMSAWVVGLEPLIDRMTVGRARCPHLLAFGVLVALPCLVGMIILWGWGVAGLVRLCRRHKALMAHPLVLLSAFVAALWLGWVALYVAHCRS